MSDNASNRQGSYYHPSCIPTEINLPSRGVELAHASTFVKDLHLDFDEPQSTPEGTELGSVSKSYMYMPAYNGADTLEICDWRKVTENGYTYAGRGVIEKVAGRHGTECTRHPYVYAINANGIGVITEDRETTIEEGRPVTTVGESRLLQMQDPTLSATSQYSLPPGTFEPPKCQVIPIEFVPPLNCYTLPPFEEETDKKRIDHMVNEYPAGDGARTQWPGGKESGFFSIPGESFRTNAWTFYRQNGQRLTRFRNQLNPRAVFVVTEGAFNVRNTTGSVQIQIE
jgi:hypothetical protein